MSENIIGRNICIRRRRSNLTQQQLAEKLFLKRQTLSNYEIGRRTPDIYELIKIADFFDITLDELVGRKRI